MNESAKIELFLRLDAQPDAAPVLLNAVENGLVHGNIYYDAPCGCVYGWLYVCEVNNGEMLDGTDNSEHITALIERYDLGFGHSSELESFAFSIQRGDTPENDDFAAELRDAILEWQGEHHE